MSEILWCDTLEDVTWPDDAVVIADADLPASLLSLLPDPLLVPAGEPLKTLERVGALAEQVLDQRDSRPMTIVAVGGGSIGDAVGFLASILWRGVDLWHVPTTLVAMVDSAHGGKTAVNLGAAKNQLGTFYPAGRILIARDVLATLPLAQRREGLAELLKGLWLGDADALATWDAEGGAEALASAPFAEIAERLFGLVRRAVDVKLDVVSRDPRETLGIRTTLNLGHTVAHALELEFGLSHGDAVAWGLATCLGISEQRSGLSFPEDLFRQVEPLLTPIPGLAKRLERPRFAALLRRDKKRVRDTLRSVLLEAPGQAVVTTEVTSDDWFDALLATEHRWRTTSRTLRKARGPYAVELELAASKSELNRALAIAALRPGPTKVQGWSDADDVRWMRHVTTALAKDSEVDVYCGQGGTTFRFALALAAARTASTRLRVHPQLMARPHDGLTDALTALGVQVTRNDDGYSLHGGFALGARSVRVRVDRSSQYATALAMLAAAGAPLTLVLETEEDGGYVAERVASRSYLEMTLTMLERAGVQVTWEGARVILMPTPALQAPQVLHAHVDESSAAVWHIARYLGEPVEVAHLPEESLQADRALLRFLERMAAHPERDLTFDMRDCSDLVPVFSAAALHHPGEVTITGAGHVRFKESNRIEDLVEAYAAVGVQVEATEDGIRVPSGIQAPRAGATWPTFEDHRLVMTGALLALLTPSIVVEEPYVVTKSYPRFWQDARRVGFSLAWA